MGLLHKPELELRLVICHRFLWERHGRYKQIEMSARKKVIAGKRGEGCKDWTESAGHAGEIWKCTSEPIDMETAEGYLVGADWEPGALVLLAVMIGQEKKNGGKKNGLPK